MKNRVLMPLIAVLWVCGFVVGYVWRTPHIVHADGGNRFTPIYRQGPDVQVYFQVFHDTETGQEIVCTFNEEHYNEGGCWLTGRVWK